MLFTEPSTDISNEYVPIQAGDELHIKANQYIAEANQLIFQHIPHIISQIIEHDVWKKRNQTYKNFGEYALDKSPDGLSISNNEMLWLLRSAMKTEHKGHWGDVLGEVDTTVRTYAKEKNIPINAFNSNLTELENNNPELFQEEMITYLPSRSRSIDGQLVKLKKNDPDAYTHVVEGRIELKEAWPQILRKKLQPIESVKNKFSSLSKEDREEFLAWLEQEKERSRTNKA